MWLYAILSLSVTIVLTKPNNETGQPCPGLPDKGPCNRQIYKWAYDPEKGACVMFVWGGCAGNDKNRFDSEYHCLRRCAPRNCKLVK